MIHSNGKQYAKVFFKKEEDRTKCKCCAFRENVYDCGRQHIKEAPCIDYRVDGGYKNMKFSWSWVEVGK